MSMQRRSCSCSGFPSRRNFLGTSLGVAAAAIVGTAVTSEVAFAGSLSRPELAREFDRVLVFAEGQLVEEGRFDELHREGKALAQLVA